MNEAVVEKIAIPGDMLIKYFNLIKKNKGYELYFIKPKSKNPEDRKARAEGIRFLAAQKPGNVVRGTLVGTLGNDNVFKIGVAFLSTGDSYNKELGKLIAFERAQKFPIEVHKFGKHTPTAKECLSMMNLLIEKFANGTTPLKSPSRRTKREDNGKISRVG
jgi:hypothetical protein